MCAVVHACTHKQTHTCLQILSTQEVIRKNLQKAYLFNVVNITEQDVLN
jgi:hypothetical protein